VQRQQGNLAVDDAMAQALNLFRAGLRDEAIALYDHIINSLPDYADARGALALAYWDLNRFTDCEFQAQTALNIDAECFRANCAMGLILFRRHELPEAMFQFEQALKGRPDLIAAINYVGMCAERLGDIDKALAYYDAAMRLQPNYHFAHTNRALAWLRNGWFDRGWQEYEWRLLSEQTPRPEMALPRWDGTNLKDKRIVVYTEQGIGDTIQLVRLLPLLKNQGAHITLACAKGLKPLLTRTGGIDDWLPPDEPTALNPELYTVIGSILGWLRIEERSIPRNIPYVYADPHRVHRWAPTITAVGGFKVGICWQGSKTFTSDHFRSIPLKHYAPLAQVRGVKLISLQKGYGEEQIAENRDRVPMTVFDNLDADGSTMMDTAALMQHLDLVVTSDTAIAHLAGAMAIPVWVALPSMADWRWMRRRTDSPWYPSMRLFRQSKLGEWDPVFEEIADALRQLIANTTPVAIAQPQDNSTAVPVTPGELFDKITILRIKSERITAPSRLANVNRELSQLESVQMASYPMTPELLALADELTRINEELWNTEDAIRDCERNKDFGQKFIDLARSVYRTNDRRAETKRRINELTGTNM
jgi:Tetratricopeptide repeat/Glycosyltransferase family 9 (heptosyltransferase)